jgi:hypothetical protein
MSLFQLHLNNLSKSRNPHEDLTLSHLDDIFRSWWTGNDEDIRFLAEYVKLFPLHANALFSLGTIEVMDALFNCLLTRKDQRSSHYATNENFAEDIIFIVLAICGNHFSLVNI